MRGLARVVAAILVASGAIVLGPPATAACHAFTVSAPSSIEEGKKVPVTIERDAAVNPSSVRVRTVAGKATAPSDYALVDQRVEFTNETSRTITIQTTEDVVPEDREEFAVKLSDGDGCTVNPNFTYGPPATIAIVDDDQAPATTAPPVVTVAPATTAPPLASATPSPSVEPTATASPEATATPTFTPFAVDVTEEGGGFPWAPVGIGIGVVAVAAGALILTRLRRGGA